MRLHCVKVQDWDGLREGKLNEVQLVVADRCMGLLQIQLCVFVQELNLTRSS